MTHKIKPFEKVGKYTTFENQIIDWVMPLCRPHSVWKVVTFVIRKTIGWHKEEDEISFSQIMQGTGIASRGTTDKAIKKAIDLGFIKRKAKGKRASSTKGPMGYLYKLNRDFQLIIPSSGAIPENGIEAVPKTSPIPENGIPTIPENGIPTIPENGNTKDNKKKTINKELNTIYTGLLQEWKRGFPNKPQPKPNTRSYRAKVKTRIRDKHFRDNWQLALQRASKNAYLQNTSWFTFGFFIKNDLNYRKTLQGDYNWLHEREIKNSNRKYVEGKFEEFIER
ncbi:MAG: replication protein [Planctomycetes bacterium]|nr:replication protein [Planctomycetota bacterium]